MPRSLLLLVLVPLSACYPETRKDGGAGRPSADVDTDTDSDTDSDTDTDTDTDIDSNAAPSAPTVSITPSEPTDADELTCAVVTESVDPDGGAVTYSYAWSSDAGASASSLTVSASLTTVGETWTCSVTASDGALSSAAGTASVGIVSSFIDYTTAHGGTMVAITAGTFEMGSDDYGPVHTVTLTRDFWIGQTEVTQAQYLAGMGVSPSTYSSCGSTCPVDTVSWADAAVYANALSAAEGLEQCYTATGSDLAAFLSGDPYACEGYRLPTEAEWEYAARGGESYVYSGSDTVGEVAWTNENSGGTTHPVAGKAANAFGLYDMGGNVWEWSNDWYDAYASGAAVDPVGAASGSGRVFRGGGWNRDPAYARVASRNYIDPGYRNDSGLGFRLARSAP